MVDHLMLFHWVARDYQYQSKEKQSRKPPDTLKEILTLENHPLIWEGASQSQNCILVIHTKI